VRDTPDMNGHLVSNVPLRQMTLYDHRGWDTPSPSRAAPFQ
jgi:hypothetical protein